MVNKMRLNLVRSQTVFMASGRPSQAVADRNAQTDDAAVPQLGQYLQPELRTLAASQ
jgi:hypothetical protein